MPSMTLSVARSWMPRSHAERNPMGCWMTTINVRTGLLWFLGGEASALHGTWRFLTRWRTPIWQERQWWLEQLRYWRSGNTMIFFPLMTSARWPLKPWPPSTREEGLQFLSELGKRASLISGDPRETTFLFQHISVAQQRGNAIAFHGTFLGSEDVTE